MVVAYATSAEYSVFVDGDAPAGIDRLLVRATEIVDDHVRVAYAVDTVTQLATDTDIAEALSDATCAVVEFWQEVGEEHDIDGLAGTEIKVGGYSGKRAPELSPRAHRILSTAGLMQPVPVVGALADGLIP